VVRHAHATKATVDIARDGDDLVVNVADNGRGLDGKDPQSDQTQGGRGLLGMRERAELLGGTLETGRAPEGGLRVTARIPMHETAGERE
jgi:signal transduction histidine kinase